MTQRICAIIELTLIRLSFLDFQVTLELDSRQKTTKRLFLAESRQTTYTTRIMLNRRQEECKDVTVYLDVSNFRGLYVF